MKNPLVSLSPNGLYCAAGDFYIDPWKPVPRAVITHAHSDHARWGCGHYLTATPGKLILQTRLGANANISSIAYGEKININGVEVSFHPAGHILGSAQIKLSHKGKTWVVSGDYKLEPDNTCAAFEPVICDVFISEATFALPIYVWRLQQEIFNEINRWWRNNQALGKTSILLGYALGKAQRLLAGLDSNIGPIYTHGSVEKLNEVYRQSGIDLPKTLVVSEQDKKTTWHKGIVLAPPSALNSTWARRFGDYTTGFASGWMLIKGVRRRNIDHGFALSDHADWPGLLQAINASQAKEVLMMHGQTAPIVRYLQEQNINAQALDTIII